ncbi:hypothetical protein, partial [Klebsiella pneumoniae]|uniref:hypothetical protein n=1 Tax=Klebsiella pneumoniae TaxID=573 RepID=UPI001D0DC021
LRYLRAGHTLSLFFADSAFNLCPVGGWRFFLRDIRLRRCDSHRNSVVCPRRNVPRVIVSFYKNNNLFIINHLAASGG